jgi:hypothetical protein
METTMTDNLLMNVVLYWLLILTVFMAAVVWKAYVAEHVWALYTDWMHKRTRDEQPRAGDVWRFEGKDYRISPGRMRPVRMGDNPDTVQRFRWALRSGDKIMWVDDADWKNKVLKTKAYRKRKGQ